jgi:hypothetical protein
MIAISTLFCTSIPFPTKHYFIVPVYHLKIYRPWILASLALKAGWNTVKVVNNIDTSQTFLTPGVNNSDFNIILIMFHIIHNKIFFSPERGWCYGFCHILPIYASHAYICTYSLHHSCRLMFLHACISPISLAILA